MVDTEEQLASFLQTLDSATWVAVDTEADSLHAYPEKVCLIQISTAYGDRLVDPLSKIRLAPLLDSLGAHELIMHGADYDLRLLRKHHQFTPKSVFDTMIAARLLGIKHFSLSHLVERYLGVKLEKGPQKANWAMRPLTERMERYARNDTHYLKPLSDALKVDLQAKGRLAWHEESCARLVSESSVDCVRHPELAWRLKGSHLLSSPALAVLREVWRWREKEAIAANRPPYFVLSHELLIALAVAAVGGASAESLIPKNLSTRRKTGLLKAITHALQLAPEHHPKNLRHFSRRPTEGEKRRGMQLIERRDTRAAELGIDPSLIASRSTISDLAHDWDKSAPELMNWQRELLNGASGEEPPARAMAAARAEVPGSAENDRKL